MEDAKLDLYFQLNRKEPEQKNIKRLIKSKIQKSCSFSFKKVQPALTGFFPVVKWLPKYRFKEYVWGDVMSGLIIGIILVPQAIAYCLLAGLQPIYGLYTSFFSNIIYFLMGTSRHISVGIFSLLSLMVGQVVDREVQLAGFDLSEDSRLEGISPEDLFNSSKTNVSSVNLTLGVFNMECGKECYAIGVATALTFLAGVYQVLMAVLRLGFVSIYLSSPMLDGFATGASLTILTVQAKYLLGVKIPRHQGFGNFVITWINIFKNIHKTNFCDLITSALCISVLVAAKELGDRYKHKLKIPLPTELFVVVTATLVSHFADLNGVYGSSISGAIPTGFIMPQVPSLNLMSRVALDAIPLAVISFAFTVSLSEMFAKKHGYTVRPNQEMLAIGFCNIIPSFFHCFTTSAALAKTMVKDSTGCQTQVSSVISALVVLLVLLFFAPLFYSLQKCVLACIIIVSLRGALRKFRDVPKQWRISKVDTLVWIVSMLSAALISTEMGLLVGVVFSMFCIVARTQLPHVAILGQIQGSVFYEDAGEYENLTAVPKVKIFRFQAPLYYANKDFFLRSLYKATRLDPLLEIAKRKKAEKKAKQLAAKRAKENVQDNGNCQVNQILVPKDHEFHTIVLDCSAIQFLDTSGISTLKGVRNDYKEVGISVLLASCNPCVLDTLKRGSYFGPNEKDISTLMFYTIHSAVQFAGRREIAAFDSEV
ncbi:sulfate anion transporter 1 [Erpetoichthys calabaricus]|uniref:sulfate anion transporter 1 n=1 Tax=Erpetoichthys calabaricus TaxID=27687 RepID=UPI00223481CC|nr:sulfate anion transporter 1 [Erpetoichthys calabaricus]XP_051784618.1 sulfate anion transporter 1 [Erpetoichthys calabaricus]